MILSLSSMAELKNKTYDRRRKSSSFLRCFGFSEEDSQSKPETATAVGSEHDHRRKKNKITLRLSLSGLRAKSSRSGARTVPVPASSVAEKPPRAEIKTILYWKSKSKSIDDDQKLIIKNITIHPGKPHNQIASPTTKINRTLQPPTPDQNPIKIPQKTNLDNRKSSAQLSSCKDDTCQKRFSFSRKIEAIRASSSQPGSPLGGKPSKPARTLRQSESFPAGARREKPEPKSVVRASEPGRTGRRFEPLVGMSVVMVTLVIMVLWGRLCAILCTSAWLYFVPRLSSAVVDPTIRRLGSGPGLDLGSEEYKKKVVLGGFLERNNHRVSL